jgi:hypothetical protein
MNIRKALVQIVEASKPAAAAQPLRKWTVGDMVHPKVGPHKGEPHKVIHVHPDGSMNIVPQVAVHAQNKYRLGAARCTDEQIDMPVTDKQQRGLDNRNTPKKEKETDSKEHVSVRDAEGKFAGRYKSMEHAQAKHKGGGVTFHPIKLDEQHEMLSEEMETYEEPIEEDTYTGHDGQEHYTAFKTHPDWQIHHEVMELLHDDQRNKGHVSLHHHEKGGTTLVTRAYQPVSDIHSFIKTHSGEDTANRFLKGHDAHIGTKEGHMHWFKLHSKNGVNRISHHVSYNPSLKEAEEVIGEQRATSQSNWISDDAHELFTGAHKLEGHISGGGPGYTSGTKHHVSQHADHLVRTKSKEFHKDFRAMVAHHGGDLGSTGFTTITASNGDKHHFQETHGTAHSVYTHSVTKALKEAEEVNEVSKDLLGKYFASAANSRGAADRSGDEKTVAKRDRGIGNAFDKLHKGSVKTPSPYKRKWTQVDEGAMSDLARGAAEHAKKRGLDREEAEDHIGKTLMAVVNQHSGSDRTKIHNAADNARREGMMHYTKLHECSTSQLLQTAAADKPKKEVVSENIHHLRKQYNDAVEERRHEDAKKLKAQIHKAYGLDFLNEGFLSRHYSDPEQGTIIHALGDHAVLDAHKIPHHDRNDYGNRKVIKTKSGHRLSVYQSGHHSGHPVISVRGIGHKMVPQEELRRFADKIRHPDHPLNEEVVVSEENSADFYVVHEGRKVSGPHASREAATTALSAYAVGQNLQEGDLNIEKESLTGEPVNEVSIDLARRYMRKSIDQMRSQRGNRDLATKLKKRDKMVDLAAHKVVDDGVKVKARNLDEGLATHHIHIEDKNGNPRGKLAVAAIDDANAKWQADQKVGQKPFRGMKVSKITRINEGEINELSQNVLMRYIPRATGEHTMARCGAQGAGTPTTKKYWEVKSKARKKGVAQAIDKLDVHIGTNEKPVKVPARLTEEEQINEKRAYVEPFTTNDGKPGFKSSNKHGKIKFWNEHGKASAYKHAGLNEESEMNMIEEGRRGRPRKDAIPGADENEREHIIVQLRKNVTINGAKKVRFADNSEHDVKPSHSERVLTHYAGLRPTEKEGFQKHIEGSHANLMNYASWKPTAPAAKPVPRQLSGRDARTIKKPLSRRPEDAKAARVNMIKNIARKLQKAKS